VRECAYAAQALEDEVSKLAGLRVGDGRNAALNIAAHSLGTMAGAGWIDPSAVVKALFEAATANGHAAKHGQAQTNKTIESGLNAGMSKPREPLAAVPDIDLSAMIANGIARYKSKQTPPASGKSSILISRGTDIQAKPIDWLWPEYLPKGMLTILAGEGGTGKSTIAFNLAATITTGGFWPDGTRCNNPSNVLIFSTEDEPETVIQPRLMAAGANPNHYGIIRGTLDDKGRKRSFDANRDMDLLRKAFQEIGSVSLLIIDPITTLVKGDINQSNVVRQSLEAVIELASEYKCSVIGITHFAKNSKGKSLIDRVLSSRAFTDLARMVWAVVQNRETDERAFGRIKTNIARENDAFPYSVEETWISEQIRTTRISWGNRVEGSSHLLLGRIEGTPENDNSGKASHVKQFLLNYLSNGPRPADEVLEAAIQQLNVCKNTVTTAKRDLNIESKKDGIGGWNWQLPFTAQLKAAAANLI
jgi:putative DNA primase/helicase